MGLEETLRSSEKLDGIFDAFDTFTVLGSVVEQKTIEPLPKEMRLTPYFIASAEQDRGHFEISGKTEFFTYEHDGKRSSSSAPQGKVSVGIGNAVLEHKVGFTIDVDKSDTRYFFQESFINLFGDGEDEHAVTIYVGNTSFFGGHDFNAINKVGAVIYVGEDFFKSFKSKHRLQYDREKYEVITSKNELTITPKFDVTKDKYDATVREIIGITNQVLKVLNESYGKNATYLKAPEVTSQVGTAPVETKLGQRAKGSK